MKIALELIMMLVAVMNPALAMALHLDPVQISIKISFLTNIIPFYLVKNIAFYWILFESMILLKTCHIQMFIVLYYRFSKKYIGMENKEKIAAHFYKKKAEAFFQWTMKCMYI